MKNKLLIFTICTSSLLGSCGYVSNLPEQNSNNIYEETRSDKNEKEKEQNTAAVKIQLLWKGHKARKKLSLLKENREQNIAATKIQSIYRGLKSRKEYSVLKEDKRKSDRKEELYKLIEEGKDISYLEIDDLINETKDFISLFGTNNDKVFYTPLQFAIKHLNVGAVKTLLKSDKIKFSIKDNFNPYVEASSILDDLCNSFEDKKEEITKIAVLIFNKIYDEEDSKYKFALIKNLKGRISSEVEEDINRYPQAFNAIIKSKFMEIFVEDEALKRKISLLALNNCNLSNEFKTLVDKGIIDINYTNQSNCTFLMLAVEKSNEDMFNYLMDKKVKVDLEDKEGINAIKIAVNKYDSFIITLEHYSKKPDPNKVRTMVLDEKEMEKNIKDQISKATQEKEKYERILNRLVNKSKKYKMVEGRVMEITK